MRKKICFLLTSLMLTAFAHGSETYVIAKVTDILGNIKYELLTRDEYAELNKQIIEENKIFSKVIAECRVEWKSDAERKGVFQASKVKARKIATSGAPYRDKEKAMEKLAKLEENVTEKRLEELDEHRRKWARVKEEDRAKEEEKLNIWRESFEMVSKKMQEALGREIPNYGFDLIAPNPNAKH